MEKCGNKQELRASDRSRTGGLRITNALLYQLSYASFLANFTKISNLRVLFNADECMQNYCQYMVPRLVLNMRMSLAKLIVFKL